MVHKPTFYEKYIKRLLDIVLSGTALIVLSPVLLITAILVKCRLGSPVNFCQERPGKDEKIFRLYKFRTMRDAVDPRTGKQLPDEERLTPFGKKLRALSLDELPELWNIFKGDMSIVGPRPLLVKYLPLYNDEQKHRHDVRPGLTGWAQVHGRNLLSWEERFAYDVWYVRNVSFLVDVKTILLTVRCVFIKEGISSGTSVTMEEFKGTREESHV
ncbi:MAG: sugar transferase [Clostridia bacterium]|nr:sugar transferase [Clostridia bacterium]